VEAAFAEHLADMLRSMVPGPIEAAGLAPASLLWAWGWLALAGWLRTRKRWPAGYTRKVFHFAIFTAAAGVHAWRGLSGVCVFGLGVSAALGYALVQGAGSSCYEALARPQDAPRRTHFIVAPYFATLAGGLLANLATGDAAIAGYLCAGFGDAVAEPVGVRWGRHRYRVPSARGVPAVRSWEGSAAVFGASFAGACGAGMLLEAGPPMALVAGALGIAAASALVEAVSPHGWDNLPMQLVPSLLALGWLA
jgi:phytol kinase